MKYLYIKRIDRSKILWMAGGIWFACCLPAAQAQHTRLVGPPRRAHSRPARQGVRPRLGMYHVYSYGNDPAISIGTLYLYPDGRYRVSTSREQGTYKYDTNKQTFRWLSGPYKQRGWGGTFRVKGSRHTIKLTRNITASSF